MPTTLNGLSSELAQRRFTIPGTTRDVTLSRDFGPILVALAADYDATVRRIDVGKLDDAGLCKRDARAAPGHLSNHYNGTAVDLNWSEEGAQNSNWGKRFFSTPVNAVKVARIKKRYGAVVRWGGDWKNFKDFMHWEIKPGVTQVQARKFMAANRIDMNGNRTSK
jgi:hypothetical protein